MLNKNIDAAFNEQINKEFFSSYLYLSMASDLEEKNLKGFAHWMKIQAEEELLHALKLFDYIHERAGRVILEAVKKPPSHWKTPIDIFENAYNHEVGITKSINALLELSEKEKDPASSAFLQWYIEEQVEEEANALEVLNKLKLIKDSSSALYMLDNELGSRIINRNNKK